ncbi:Nitrilase/cyanide hydratase and apolipoprotein N-acyltransferase [Hymenobacter roseosalivarius DSM 11622]|uniref:Nitrilase/cyanide hydratase and apolipoprotein N-acyltransferase n=1 Tax=Hymenobacter roseosalivarius DSM 11622 TaxID=645990 RepID=A0A1W1W3R7_9BACT|nr:carbon-nitrogen hydrolase family protein [Hymenobacter roseosalivarius]SMC00259.1 Nitrilase/cyanide hydratase and apolipoprotein N-acyltransferase [Hymenobacter roseosalivarius DSM 11622]
MAALFSFRKAPQAAPIAPAPVTLPPTTTSVRVGMGQLLVEGGEPARNLERAARMIAEAAGQGCELILLPETLDFAWTHPSALTEAQPIPGPFSDLLCQQAVEHNIYVCAGLTERLNGRNYNAAILINPEGEIIVKYHKINLLAVELPFYAVGQTLNVVDTPLGKIGVNICADNYLDGLPIGHTLARMGAEFIISPSSWTVDYSLTEEDDPYREKWVNPFSILARLYNVVVVGTTSVGYIVGGPYEGKKSVGCSLAVDASGVRAQGTFNEFAGDLVVADLPRPIRSEQGTAIGEMLQRKGYQFDKLL